MISATASCETGVKRCAIYIRVSTAMQRMEGWSLAAQESSLKAFAKAKGWKVVDIYADEGKSARKRLKGRKEIFRLLDDVRAGKIDVILFKELDRWFRSVSDFYKVQDVLDEYGVTWVSERQPNLGMATKEDRLQVNLLLSVGQNETDSTSDRIKYTQKFLREQKRWTSGPRTLPRCYTLDQDQHVIIDPERAPFVRAIIDYIFQTGSVRGALVRANAEFNQRWMYCNCVTTLRNPMLWGKNKEVDDFVAEPLLTREEFDRLQELMTRNARGDTEHFYIFSNMLKCADCSHSMAGNATTKELKKGTTVYKYYRCNLNRQSRQCPHSINAKEDKIEKQLLGIIEEAIAGRIAHVKKVTQDHKKRPKKKGNRALIEKRLKKLKMTYVEDDEDRMSFEQYQKERKAILAQLIEDEPEPELPELADLEKIQELLSSGVLELYKDFTDEEKRAFWRGILRQVVVKNGRIVDVDFIE